MGVSGGPGIRPGVLGEAPLPGAWTPGGPPRVWLLNLAGLRPAGSTNEDQAAGELRLGGPATVDPPSGGPRPVAAPDEEAPAGGPRSGSGGLPDEGPQVGESRPGGPGTGRLPGAAPGDEVPGDGLSGGGLAGHGLPDAGTPSRRPLDAALRDHDRILDPAERERAAAFVRDLHRDRYIASHIGLRLLLGAYLATDPAEVVLVREPCPGCGGPHGRPAVAGAPLHFNLSHAGDLALFAFADTPVGADVEQLQPADVVEEVARVLHPTETAELAALPAEQRPEAFARCWTRKEAYLKGTGTGLSENPSVTYVGTGPGPASPAGWTLSDVEAVPGYAAAVAVANARVSHAPHGR